MKKILTWFLCNKRQVQPITCIMVAGSRSVKANHGKQEERNMYPVTQMGWNIYCRCWCNYDHRWNFLHDCTLFISGIILKKEKKRLNYYMCKNSCLIQIAVTISVLSRTSYVFFVYTHRTLWKASDRFPSRSTCTNNTNSPSATPTLSPPMFRYQLKILILLVSVKNLPCFPSLMAILV